MARWWLMGRPEDWGSYHTRGNILQKTCSCPRTVAEQWAGRWETKELMKLGGCSFCLKVWMLPAELCRGEGLYV